MLLNSSWKYCCFLGLLITLEADRQWCFYFSIFCSVHYMSSYLNTILFSKFILCSEVRKFQSSNIKGFFSTILLLFLEVSHLYTWRNSVIPINFSGYVLIFIQIHKHGISHAFRSPLTSHWWFLGRLILFEVYLVFGSFCS